MHSILGRPPKYHNTGFTLIELISVLVILGIVAALGSSFLVSTVSSYNQVQQRSKLLNKGRLVIEQMTRQVRTAMPNSVRVSGSGNCLEFLPLIGGARYINDVPDAQNMAPATLTVATAAFSLAAGNAVHASVGALSEDEIYSSGSPNGRVGIASVSGGAPSAVNFSSSHRFLRNSVNKRVFIADNPVRFCMIAGTLYEYSSYGFVTGALSDFDPGGATAVMAEGVSTSSAAFSLTAGTEDLNTVLDISLVFSTGDNQVGLDQMVLIRNVP